MSQCSKNDFHFRIRITAFLHAALQMKAPWVSYTPPCLSSLIRSSFQPNHAFCSPGSVIDIPNSLFGTICPTLGGRTNFPPSFLRQKSTSTIAVLLGRSSCTKCPASGKTWSWYFPKTTSDSCVRYTFDKIVRGLPGSAVTYPASVRSSAPCLTDPFLPTVTIFLLGRTKTWHSIQ